MLKEALSVRCTVCLHRAVGFNVAVSRARGLAVWLLEIPKTSGS